MPVLECSGFGWLPNALKGILSPALSSRVQRFPFLGLLPPPTDGRSDITELYVARYGVPSAGKAIWIRTCQHTDGWTDVPKVTRSRVPAPAP